MFHKTNGTNEKVVPQGFISFLEKFKKIYNTVLRSQLISIETAKEGMTGEEIDRISRDIISEEGYGENFGHSLGHGVGLEVHENPGVGPNSKNEIIPGMVYTIEPGIYVNDSADVDDKWKGIGIRIENDILITDDGFENLTSDVPVEINDIENLMNS